MNRAVLRGVVSCTKFANLRLEVTHLCDIVTNDVYNFIGHLIPYEKGVITRKLLGMWTAQDHAQTRCTWFSLACSGSFNFVLSAMFTFVLDMITVFYFFLDECVHF